MTQYQDSKKETVKTNTVADYCNYADNYYGDCVCLTSQPNSVEKVKAAAVNTEKRYRV